MIYYIPMGSLKYYLYDNVIMYFMYALFSIILHLFHHLVRPFLKYFTTNLIYAGLIVLLSNIVPQITHQEKYDIVCRNVKHKTITDIILSVLDRQYYTTLSNLKTPRFYFSPLALSKIYFIMLFIINVYLRS